MSTILKISSKQDTGYTKSVAGAICWQFSENGICHARAAKCAAINNLVKAAAITQSRVEKASVVIGMELNRITEDKLEVVDVLMKEADGTPKETFDFKVSGAPLTKDDDYTKLTEALVFKAKNDVSVSLKCIGKNAVYRAVMASLAAKERLKGYKVVLIPAWQTFVGNKGNDVSLIRLDFYSRKV